MNIGPSKPGAKAGEKVRNEAVTAVRAVGLPRFGIPEISSVVFSTSWWLQRTIEFLLLKAPAEPELPLDFQMSLSLFACTYYKINIQKRQETGPIAFFSASAGDALKDLGWCSNFLPHDQAWRYFKVP